MSSPPIPTKPPRGVKQGKETSGLLMSVIRTLSASETNEQREKERAKLEKEYKKSDARLDELVAQHAQEIMDVMQKFTLVNEALQSWGVHGEAAVARLTACRGLLRLRRADLRRLWTDARTHHHALTMLTDIERVVVSEREAKESLQGGRVLSAAHTIRSALALADTTLSHVTALNATTQHLQAKKREVVDVIVRRLFDCVLRSERTPLARRHSERRRTALLLAELTKPAEVVDSYLTDVTPEYEAALSEEDSSLETTAAIALEALAVLGQLKEAAEKFKVQIQNELMEIIDQVSRRIIEDGDVELQADAEEDGAIPEEEGVTEAARPLARLVAYLTEEFEACGAKNKRLIHLWRSALQKHGLPESCLHTEQHYWSAVQQVMQLLLTEYLQIESVTMSVARGGRAVEATSDMKLYDYFAKKRPQRRREKLFRLAEYSMSVAGGRGRARARQVSAPSPAHLPALLPPLHALCAHIELIQGGECTLRAFITDYVKSGESERLASEARAKIEAAAKAGGAWSERASPPHNPALNASDRPMGVFLWAVSAWQALEQTAEAARRCGTSGGGHAAAATTHAIGPIATQCLSAYSRLCPQWSRAARWLADDDIVRFLQSLPNWWAMLHPNDKPSQQELNQAYEREAEILGSSLGDGAVTRREIIADVSVLIDLAMLAESMAWLSASIRTLPAIISAPSAGGTVRLPDKFAADVAAAAAIFDDIAHKCLLLLHLEVRIECFHYLGEEDRGEEGEGGAAGSGAGGGAAQLSARLLAFHEGAANAIAPHRLAYVLNGLGEMMSAGVVWRWQESSGAGVGAGASGRLACLRHCLAALQLPHSGLQRATSYLHLLNCTPEEIIASVKEKGPQFSELEYLNAFKLIGARRGLQPAEMRAHLKQLSSALGHVGVTV